jgi:gamma-aminobutyric acid type B receptor
MFLFFRLIKMSSPNINNIINCNCLLLYLCPIFNSIKGLNVTNDFLSNMMCQINSWIIPICSTMLYAAMLAKAWRIFKIFDTTPKMKKIVIKDIRLVIYILIMVAIDVCVLLVWQFYDPIRVKIRFLYENHYSLVINKNNLTNSTDMEKSLTNNTTVQPSTQIKLIYECNSSFNEVWITVLTIYKIILLMYGIYLSWLIRNVNVPSMNDAKYLLLSTYTIIVCGLGSMTLIQV